jgi:YVTN family beta-propeller protein
MMDAHTYRRSGIALLGVVAVLALPIIAAAQAATCLPGDCLDDLQTPTRLPTRTSTATFPTRTPTATASPSLTPVPTAPRVPTSTPGAAATPATSWEYLYVANSGADTVSVIDAADNRVVATVAVGARPTGVAVSPDSSLVWVTNTASNDISLIDTRTNLVTGTIGGIDSPTDIVMRPDGQAAYVARQGATSVDVVDTATRTVVQHLGLEHGTASAMTLSPDGATLFVGEEICGFWSPGQPRPPHLCRPFNTYCSGVLSLFDTATGAHVATIDEQAWPLTGLAVSPDGDTVYTVAHGSCEDGSTLSVIDRATQTVRTHLALSSGDSVTLSADGSRGLLTSDDGISVVDMVRQSVDLLIPTGMLASRVVLGADGRRAYVTNPMSYTVSVVDNATNTEIDVIAVQARPNGIAAVVLPRPFVSPTPTATTTPASLQSCAYVATDDGVSIINTQTRRVTNVVRAVAGVSSLALSPDGRFLLAARNAGDLAIVNATTREIVATILPGSMPLQVAFTPDGAFAYVLFKNSGNPRRIAVLDTRTWETVTNIETGEPGTTNAHLAMAPGGIAYLSATVCVRGPCEARLQLLDTVHHRRRAEVTLVVRATAGRIAVSPDGTRLYAQVEQANRDAVVVVDTAILQVLATLPIPWSIQDIGVSADSRRVYVLGAAVGIVDATTYRVTGTNPASSGRRIATLADGSETYIASGTELLVLDGQSDRVVDAVTVGSPGIIAAGAALNGCIDADAATPRPTRTPPPTYTPTQTVTPTTTLFPTNTPPLTYTPTVTPLPIVVVAEDAIAPRGGTMRAAVHVETHGYIVVGLQADVQFGAHLPIAARADGRPDCIVNPLIDKPATSFIFLPFGCTRGIDCNRVRAVIFAVDNVAPIADGSLLFTCRISVPLQTAAGSYALDLVGLKATDARGLALPVVGRNAALSVAGAPPCVADCDSGRTVEVDELILATRIAVGDSPITACSAADADGDGEVTIDELIRGVNYLMDGCP